MAQRRQYGGAFKTRVVVEAIAGHRTVNEIAFLLEHRDRLQPLILQAVKPFV